MRLPSELDAGIQAHKAVHGAEPRLIMIRDQYRELHKSYFAGRVHILCCGKGAIYAGIPAILTGSGMLEDFLICY